MFGFVHYTHYTLPNTCITERNWERFFVLTALLIVTCCDLGRLYLALTLVFTLDAAHPITIAQSFFYCNTTDPPSPPSTTPIRF